MKRFLRYCVLGMVGIGIFSSLGWGAPVSENQVRQAVSAWLEETPNHFGESLGKSIGSITRYRGGVSGSVGYYLVILSPRGWVVFPGDDGFWPVQTFGAGVMTPERFEKSLWYPLTSFGDFGANRNAQAGEERREVAQNQRRWKGLLERGPSEASGFSPAGSPYPGLSASADIRVAPLLGNERFWSQGDPFNALMNHENLTEHSTLNPNYGGSNVQNLWYPSGCVPLSMGQVMLHILTRRYSPRDWNGIFLSTDAAPGDATFSVARDYGLGGTSLDFTFPGGDLFGGYDWNAMDGFLASHSPLEFSSGEIQSADLIGEDLAAAEEAGRLLRDLGVSMGVTYSVENTLGGRNPIVPPPWDFFGRINVLLARPDSSAPLLRALRSQLINPNLDLGFPVVAMLRLETSNQEFFPHAAPVDGYAYDVTLEEGDTEEPYYHVVTGHSLYGGEDASLDPGGWSRGLWGELFSHLPSPVTGITNLGIIYNMLFSLQGISSDLSVNYGEGGVGLLDQAGGTVRPSLISGRLLKAPGEGENWEVPLEGVEVGVSWDSQERYRLRTNEKGIFAGLVGPLTGQGIGNFSFDVVLRSPDAAFVPRVLWEGTSGFTGNKIYYPDEPDPMFILNNRWNPSIRALSLGGVEGEYETSSEQRVVLEAQGNEEGRDFVILSSSDFAEADLSYLGSGVLFIASDSLFDYHGNYPSNTVLKVMDFVKKGGTLITSGKSTVFPAVMAFSQGLRYDDPLSLPEPCGNAKKVNSTVSSQARKILQNLGGANSFFMQSQLPLKQHSVIQNPGTTEVLSTCKYVMRKIINGPWGPEWDYSLYSSANTLTFNYKKGRVFYMNGDLSLNYATEGLPRDYVNALVGPVILERENRGTLASSVGGEYEADPTSRPLDMNSLNLKGVVYNGGIELENLSSDESVSFVFILTDRMLDSMVPNISSDGTPSLTVSLYNVSGDRVATRQTTSSSANTLAFSVPSNQNLQEGIWKMGVDVVSGYDGRRVVLAACVPGEYDEGTDVIPPASSMHTALSYPRGLSGKSFYHQIGGGSQTLDSSEVAYIHLGAMTRKETLEVWKVEKDLVLALEGALEKITLPNWFIRERKDFTVALGDGILLGEEELRSMAQTREPERDITPVVTEKRLEGSPEDDSLAGTEANEFFAGGLGNDRFHGGGGSNIYYYRRGDGKDILESSRGFGEISRKNLPRRGIQVIRFHMDISSEDVEVTSRKGDLVLTLGNGGSMTIQNWKEEGNFRVEFFQGDIWDSRDLEALSQGTPLASRHETLDFQKEASPLEVGTASSGASGGGGCNGGYSPLMLLGLLGLWGWLGRGSR